MDKTIRTGRIRIQWDVFSDHRCAFLLDSVVPCLNNLLISFAYAFLVRKYSVVNPEILVNVKWTANFSTRLFFVWSSHLRFVILIRYPKSWREALYFSSLHSPHEYMHLCACASVYTCWMRGWLTEVNLISKTLMNVLTSRMNVARRVTAVNNPSENE